MNWDLAGHVGWELFYWPGGIVVGNLIANMIWEWPSQVIHAVRTKKQNHKQTEHIKAHINQAVPNVQTGF